MTETVSGNLSPADSIATEFQFEPIEGYPMLNWRGKRPFVSSRYYPAQLREVYGDPTDGWLNKLYWGDNLQVMSHLLHQYRGAVDLVYIDPPFDSKADYKKTIELRGRRASNSRNAFEEKQYTDIWVNDEYLQFMYERLTLIRELMSANASIYVHCDYRKSHYLKLILDELFGPNRFINEIIWVRTNAHNMKSKGYVRSNDHILLYSKGPKFTFNEQFLPYSEAQLKRYKPDEQGRLYTGQDLTFSTDNPDRQDEWRGTRPPNGRSWGYDLATREKLWNEGRILTKRDGTPRLDGLKVFLDDGQGNPLTTNWTDISRIGNTSSERLDYPTQKPESLLDRILAVSSNSGDLVFDGFIGSGTTAAVAMKSGRRFLGADINLGAIQTTINRLSKIASGSSPELSTALRYYGFELYNVNHYDVFRNPAQAKDLLLDALQVQRTENGSIYDGERGGRMVKIMPVNRIATRADITDLLATFDYRTFERRQEAAPFEPVEKLLLVCMGHEPDLKAELELEVRPYKIDVEIVDILRDGSKLEFKRDSEAQLAIRDGFLMIEQFYPMNLLQKLSLQNEDVVDWRELAESVLIDWSYDGAVLRPAVIDVPSGQDMVAGRYPVPRHASSIWVKITDLLSESWEGTVDA